MKKAVALLMILAVTTTTTLFAIPVSATGSVDASSAEATTAGLSIQTDAATELSIQTDITDDADDLFADVQAVALTPVEAIKVAGEGAFGFLASSIINYFIAPIIYTQVYTQQTAFYDQSRAQINAIGVTVIVGSVITGIGIICPW